MKKVLPIVLLIIFIVSLFILCACNPKATVPKIASNISYVEFVNFWGEGENFFVEITEGKREHPLNANGKSQNVKSFFEIKIYPLKTTNLEILNIALLGDDYSLNCEAKLSLTENEFVFSTFEHQAFSQLNTLTVVDESVSEVVELADMSKEHISWQDAHTIAQTEFEERLKDDKGREIFIKMTMDRQHMSGECFWYVCYIGEKNDFWSLLIDAKTGRVVAKK